MLIIFFFNLPFFLSHKYCCRVSVSPLGSLQETPPRPSLLSLIHTVGKHIVYLGSFNLPLNPVSRPEAPGFSAPLPPGNQQEERLWKLQEENQELLLRVSDRSGNFPATSRTKYATTLLFKTTIKHLCFRDHLQQELNNLRANYVSLESLQHNTKVQCCKHRFSWLNIKHRKSCE